MQRCTQATLTLEKAVQLSLEAARSLEGLGMGMSSEKVGSAKEKINMANWHPSAI